MSLLYFAGATAYGYYQSYQGQFITQDSLFAAVGLATAIALMVYIVQSYFLPTTSDKDQLNKMDLLKGLIVTVGAAAGDIIADNATRTSVSIKGVLFSIFGVVAGYLVKQYKSNPVA